MQNEYATLSELQQVAEALPEDFETADFSTSEILPPGNMTSLTRTISGRRRDDGHYSFQINFTGGLTDENGRQWGRGGFEKTWVTTVPMVQQNRPGKTSSAAEYLRACGFETKGLTIEAIFSAMEESQNIPVQVFVSRTNKTEKGSDGKYPRSVLKLQDFNIGTKEEPKWATSVVRDGQTYVARHKFGSFRKVA